MIKLKSESHQISQRKSFKSMYYRLRLISDLIFFHTMKFEKYLGAKFEFLFLLCGRILRLYISCLNMTLFTVFVHSIISVSFRLPLGP